MTAPKYDYKDTALRETFVYRAYDATGRCLYVGATARPKLRLRAHRQESRLWINHVARWKVSGPYNYRTARRLERAAMRSERPAYGQTPFRRSHNPDSPYASWTAPDCHCCFCNAPIARSGSAGGFIPTDSGWQAYCRRCTQVGAA